MDGCSSWRNPLSAKRRRLNTTSSRPLWLLTETTQSKCAWPWVLTQFNARQIDKSNKKSAVGRLAIFKRTCTRLNLAVPSSCSLIASKQKTARSCLPLSSFFLTLHPSPFTLLTKPTHTHYPVCKFQLLEYHILDQPTKQTYNILLGLKGWLLAAPGRKDHVDQLSTYFWIWFNPKKYFLHQLNFFSWFLLKTNTTHPECIPIDEKL